MAAKRLSFYLVKIVRLSGWILFLLVLLYIITGYAMCGEFGFGYLIDSERALTLHKLFDVPLVFVVLIHSLTGIYLALRRWRWIGRKPVA
jgi:succinate dehydrogenase/fumarate reductase cytochrome b subunit